MRRKREHVTVKGGPERETKEKTHTHTRPYANTGEDTGVHEDTHPGQMSRHAARALQ